MVNLRLEGPDRNITMASILLAVFCNKLRLNYLCGIANYTNYNLAASVCGLPIG